jgi:signal transduction histidine kinase/ActR/RegA family two-component response regulator
MQVLAFSRSSILKPIIVGAAVFAMVLLSLLFTRYQGHVSVLWLANAIAVAAVLRAPGKSWFALIAAATLANLAAKLAVGEPPGVSLATSLASALEIFVCAWVARRLAGRDLDVSRPRHLAILAGSALLVATPLAALCGGTALWLSRGLPLFDALQSWWRPDALGLLIGAPMLLALTRESVGELWRTIRTGRGALSAIGLAISLALTFGQRHYPLIGLVPPALILTAFELNLAGAAIALLLTALVMLATVIFGGQGPLSEHLDFNERLLMGQIFLVAMTVMVLPVAAVLASRRRLEIQLREALAEAQAAAVAKSEFLANMSHEIRTPLTAIIGFSGLLDGSPGLPPKAALYIDRIARSGRTLLSIVNDILDFSKMEAGQVVLNPRCVDPEALARETMDLVADQAASKGLGLTLSCDGLPGRIEADGERLAQILLNLLANAIKFTSEGGVTVRMTHQSGVLRVMVSDTGEGVAPALRDRLFERFWQVDSSSTRRYGGTGLGLAICKSLVGLMGGEIGVDGGEAGGSTFWFTVQAPVAEIASPIVAKSGDRLDALQVAAAHILVVDDVAANRELVRAMLVALGHSLEEADGGAEAVRAAEQTRFDLILMDMQMPGMDGLAATRAIRAASPLNARTPIVALTANVLPDHVAHCFEAGMDDHMAKPIAPALLLQKIAQWSGVRSAAAPGQAA